MNDILMKRKESLAELRLRIAQSTLKAEDLRINRPPYRKTSDLFDSEYFDELFRSHHHLHQNLWDHEISALSFNPWFLHFKINL